MTAQQIVDELTEGRFRDFLSNAAEKVKDVTGIGRDEFGMGKNTEKGWKPKYAVNQTKKPVAPRKEIRSITGEKTWEL